MTASLHFHWRVTLAAALIAGGAVAGALNHADEPAPPDARPLTCADVSPCLHAGSPETARSSPGDRARLMVAIIMGCRWEPCDRV